MGRSEAERLKQGGIPTAKPSFTKVPVDFIKFAPKGHALWHPREHLPIDRELVDSIKRGFRTDKPIVVYEEGIHDGVMLLHLVAGSRRTNHARVAQDELRTEGKLPLPGSEDNRLFVPIRIVSGGYTKALEERLVENSDPLKLPDSPSVLYETFAQLRSLGAEVAQIAAVAPRGVDVEAVLRWPSLSSDAKDRLNEGDVPLCVIDAVADLPVEQQLAALLQMIDEKATTPRKARKLVRRITHPQRSQFLPVPASVVDRVAGHLAAASDRDSRVARAVLHWRNGDDTLLAELAPDLLAQLNEGKKPPEKPAKGARP